MLGAAAMSLSSFCVVTNALRLNLFDAGERVRAGRSDENKLSLTGSDESIRPDNKESQESEEGLMQKTMNIEGMMCPHCEAAVKKALEALDGVKEAAVSHESGTALVTLSAEVSDAALKEAVEAKEYKVLSIA